MTTTLGWFPWRNKISEHSCFTAESSRNTTTGVGLKEGSQSGQGRKLNGDTNPMEIRELGWPCRVVQSEPRRAMCLDLLTDQLLGWAICHWARQLPSAGRGRGSERGLGESHPQPTYQVPGRRNGLFLKVDPAGGWHTQHLFHPHPCCKLFWSCSCYLDVSVQFHQNSEIQCVCTSL